MAVDPSSFAKTYGDLLSSGKGYGLQGPELQKYIEQGLSVGSQGELGNLASTFLQIRREERDPAYRKQILQDQLAFDKERMAEAGKYKMLFGIPDTISQAFGNQAAMNVLGARSVTDAYNAALQAYPRAQFASYQFQPQSYLS